MALTAGTRLGVYEVIASIGAGGMGEVFRARDTKLNRDVALKVLPDSLASDPDRLARFTREAQTLAALNHPNIAHIHGFEETGGVRAIVMELIEGNDLSQRIARGPIPLSEALPIAKQIANALEAAHAQGIIHRDLKPANIKFRADRTVKVLDFGLAKALDQSDAMAASVTTAPLMTRDGAILGTAAYMSPEQAKGQPVDKRSDLWAYGAVFYEMLTGTRAFKGDDVSDTIAAILRDEPKWSALPADLPAPIVTLLKGCLQKERHSRIPDISVASFVLNHAVQLVEPGRRPVAPPLWRRAIPIAAALVIGALLAGAGLFLLTRPAPASVVRTTLATSGSAALTLSGNDRDLAITPDGSRVVYRGDNHLLVRPLDQFEPKVLSNLGAPQGVFISPDGQWIGFFDDVYLLKKVAITGGTPLTVCAIQGVPRGATWSEDGTIIFATNAPAIGLQRVPAGGGEPAVLTTPDLERGEADHLWPEFLPGGAGVLYTIIPSNGDMENAQIAVMDLRTGRSEVVIRGGSHGHYVPTGHLVYGAAGTLHAVQFDLGRLKGIGAPAPVLDGVLTTSNGGVDVAVAANGSLVYVQGGPGGGGLRTVVSVDREGRPSQLPGVPPDSYREIRVSPDGTRLAFATRQDVWTYDVARATLSRLTTDPARDNKPLWTPNGDRIIFTSTRAGYEELFWRLSDGSGSDERLLTGDRNLLDLRGDAWSADGKQLLLTEVTPDHRCAIAEVAIERPSDAHVLVKSEACNWYAAVSPNGAWIAYQSDVSRRNEIYVERYPELGSRQKISTDGGRLPLWSRDGRELFFSSEDNRQILAVPVQSGTTLVAGRPQVLFESAMDVTLGGRPYDVTPDGRFVIILRGQAEGGDTAPNLILVQNWFDEVKQLVPPR